MPNGHPGSFMSARPKGYTTGSTDGALRASPTATNLTSPQSCCAGNERFDRIRTRSRTCVEVGVSLVDRTRHPSKRPQPGDLINASELARASHASNRQPSNPRLARRRTDAGRRPRPLGGRPLCVWRLGRGDPDQLGQPHMRIARRHIRWRSDVAPDHNVPAAGQWIDCCGRVRFHHHLEFRNDEFRLELHVRD